MAKIVLAGSADCPYYAKNEILADSLVKNLSGFILHKIVKQPEDWKTWLEDICAERGWKHAKSPIIWRELVDRGGKGLLIGGSNEFQEYCCKYYGITSEFTSDDMLKVANENLVTKVEVDKEEADVRAQSKPIFVAITHASSPVCYGMLNSFAQGDIFGQDVEIILRFLDVEDHVEYLEGTKMECMDCSHGLLRSVEVTTDPEVAFKDCTAVVFLDDLQQNEGEENDEWLIRNNELFAKYGTSLNSVARPDVKVIIAGGGPINFNAIMLIKNAPSVPKENIVALARTVECQAKAILAKQLCVNSSDVVDTLIWGNVNARVGSTNIADVSRARVHNYEGAITGPPFYSVLAAEMVHNDEWLATDFGQMLQKRLLSVEEALGRNGSMAQAVAILTTFQDWLNGAPPKQMFSLGVYSDGYYGIPEDIVFSLPVRFCGNGKWSVVEGLNIDEPQQEKLTNIANELLTEKEVIYPDPNRVNKVIEEDDEQTNQNDASEENEKSDPEKPETPAQAEASPDAAPTPTETAAPTPTETAAPTDTTAPTHTDTPAVE